MRVSPTLLACFSLVAILGLPGRAEASTQGIENEIAQPPLSETSTTPAKTLHAHLLDGVLQPSDSKLLAITPAAISSASTTADPQPALKQLESPDPINDALPDADEPTPAEPIIIFDEDGAEIEDIDIDNADEEPIEETVDEAIEEATEDPSIESDPEPDEPSPPSLEDLLQGVSEEAPAAEPEESEEPVSEEIPEETPAEEPEETPAAEPEETVQEETRVLVAEVDVVSSNPQRPLNAELIDAVYSAVETVPGRTTTRSQLQEDINSVFSTGFFSNVQAEPEDTPLGVRVTFAVEPNPVLSQVNVRNRIVLPDETIDDIFSDQYGQILNLRDLQNSILDLNDWYQDNGYVLAQVTASPQISDQGVVTLIVAEGEIEEIAVRYLTSDGETTDEEGNPVDGKTRAFIITREFESEPGDVFQEDAIQQDIAQVFGLGIFEDIRLSLDPGDEDPRKVKVVVNVAERDTGSIGASLGFNLRGDLFGQLSYNEDNLGGNNQKLRTEGRLTTRGDFLFDVSFTDPWIAGDPFRTSYTVSLFNRRATSLIFDNGPIDVDLPNGDTPRLNRLGTGISFSRPLDNGLSLSLGGQYERVAILDSDGDVFDQDELGNELTESGTGRDDLFTLQFGAVLDRRNDPGLPTSGNLFRVGTEQSIPIGSGNVFFNKIRGSYSQYVPLRLLGGDSGRETIAFNVQGGLAVGDLPPYEEFPLGGGNSVRGFEEGGVGSGEAFLLGTVEYRFPLFTQFLNGALFADYGTDLGSGRGANDPAAVRGKPGSGFGYGAGVRVQTPLGALRLDYGIGSEGDSRFHFGFGERF
ncbi:outer membrane protein, OMP85 family, putative [Synechococcus sp. PCC 7335]|uniref:BamA/TamA family outer membrane protein n=1 Tax=Synechococcus sp. (strain ATCC 29403 / PCC 7335) TaxID=91464 RepID=UPI00017EE433|nr:BamA/TamA family outer membrane protein [Synechococcus sp. PCC 7335]EDX87817.1 outer membrane protein, OMP85 family, putative [Synechococcus sp. PCC 7335]